jgi:hypothetical protein
MSNNYIKISNSYGCEIFNLNYVKKISVDNGAQIISIKTEDIELHLYNKDKNDYMDLENLKYGFWVDGESWDEMNSNLREGFYNEFWRILKLVFDYRKVSQDCGQMSWNCGQNK